MTTLSANNVFIKKEMKLIKKDFILHNFCGWLLTSFYIYVFLKDTGYVLKQFFKHAAHLFVRISYE